MFFLLRVAFWLSLVILLLPADGETGDKAPRVTAFETLSAAQAAVSDISQFCDRNPDVCVTGGNAFQVFSEKVRYGVKLITNTFGNKKPAADQDGGASTLSPDDMKPAWRDPKKHEGAA
ncbi:MAG TPA: DUF5330 domain-containing protein [Bauldia sp.]|nr:DUF5330 domain-containing protein [Bauldia sp.]